MVGTRLYQVKSTVTERRPVFESDRRTTGGLALSQMLTYETERRDMKPTEYSGIVGKQHMTSADSLTWIWNVSRADGTHRHCDVGAVALCSHGAGLTKWPCDLSSLVSVIWKHTEEESA